ncbi:hypothetical protein MASR1M107_27720 [Ignavibacteriales bacterium]
MNIYTVLFGLAFLISMNSILPQQSVRSEKINKESSRQLSSVNSHQSFFIFGVEGGLSLIGKKKIADFPFFGRSYIHYYGMDIGCEIGVAFNNTAFKSTSNEPFKSDLIIADIRLVVIGGRRNFNNLFISPYFGIGAVYSEFSDLQDFSLSPKDEKRKLLDLALLCGLNADIPISELFKAGITLGVTWINHKNGFEYWTFPEHYYTLTTRIAFGKNGYVKDSDKDGIRDSDEEDIYRTNPKNADTDGDRISDYNEIFKYKTDPLKADTDGDGIGDGDEVYNYKTNPLNNDSDGDGISDSDEILQYKINPLLKDADWDGISDYDEIFKYKSDPLKADTDGDGLSDYDEVFTYKTNPSLADTDGDGITDRDELKKFNTDPFKMDTDGDGINDRDEIVVYRSNALKSDSDGDGVNDYDEIFVYKTKVLVFDTDTDQISDGDEVFRYHTNPVLVDSDNDGLGDYQEIFYYYTNPLLIDSDNSGVDDKTEVERGTDPNDKEDDVIEVNKIIVLEGIEFEFKKANITHESDRRLQKTLKLLQAFPNYTFSLEGHTDDIGGRQFNQKLSLDRANAVKTWLVNHGINAKRLTVKGFGFDRPIATNDTEEGRQRNRRVEFIRTN